VADKMGMHLNRTGGIMQLRRRIRVRIPELDGLRTVAILGVLVIHANSGLMPGGHLGVSVFFVLSGYLITTLLLKERSATGSIDFRSFYVKRAARLFPALAVVLVVAGTWSLTHENFAAVAIGVGAAALYIANFTAAAFGGAGVAHFEWAWTLSLEEQFYFIWPILLVTLLRRRSIALIVAVSGVVVSELFRVVTPLEGDTPWLFFAPHTRMSGLLLGSALAIVLSYGKLRLSNWVAQAGATASAGVIAAGFFLAPLGSRNTFSIWIPVVEVATAVLIFALLGSNVWFSAILAWKPVAYLGMISYGMYLWNIPVVLFLGSLGLRGSMQQPLEIALTILIAAGSFHFIEKPAGIFIRRYAKPREVPEKAVAI
jgi:peptidoglycan/LPS O-acetylase OafA/YrhL